MIVPVNHVQNTASFRDPSGFVFQRDGVIYRRINECYLPHYEHFMKSGLYSSLIEAGLLVAHQETSLAPDAVDALDKTIMPNPIPMISYPYEWSFSQLKDAALLTLQIHKEALKHGMILKDASAYNVQFKDSKPIFIDTLSFEMDDENEPWVAYRQFCQHFLAPLALMSYKSLRLNQLLKVFIDGVPLDLAARLLPMRTWLSFSCLIHIHVHSMSQRYYSDKALDIKKADKPVRKNAKAALVDNLESWIRKLTIGKRVSQWSRYYEDTNYTSAAFERKKELVKEYIESIRPQTVWDLGANTGEFSHIASEAGCLTLSLDSDHLAVERNYILCREMGKRNILPLVQDLTNPSPGIGWSNQERLPLVDRGRADAVLALALIHHLALSNHVPFTELARFFFGLAIYLVIEFVPKSDSQVEMMLATRKDIFPWYSLVNFEREFSKYFKIIDASSLPDSSRVLYLMKGKSL